MKRLPHHLLMEAMLSSLLLVYSLKPDRCKGITDMVGLIRASPIHPIFSLVTGFCISTTPIGLYNLFIGFRSYALFIFTERYKKKPRVIVRNVFVVQVGISECD